MSSAELSRLWQGLLWLSLVAFGSVSCCRCLLLSGRCLLLSLVAWVFEEEKIILGGKRRKAHIGHECGGGGSKGLVRLRFEMSGERRSGGVQCEVVIIQKLLS